jgi:hypothetical protein
MRAPGCHAIPAAVHPRSSSWALTTFSPTTTCSVPFTPIEPPSSPALHQHDPFHDPFVMFAYLAAITERLQFATGS